MSSPAPVAVAVASWNTRDLLAEYLGTVLSGRVGAAEVWVVDHASPDGSPDFMASVVRLVRSAANLGFSLAVNLLAERTGVSLDRAANPHIRLEPKALSLC